MLIALSGIVEQASRTRDTISKNRSNCVRRCGNSGTSLRMSQPKRIMIAHCDRVAFEFCPAIFIRTYTAFDYLAILGSTSHRVSVCCTLSASVAYHKAGTIVQLCALRMQHFPFVALTVHLSDLVTFTALHFEWKPGCGEWNWTMRQTQSASFLR